MSRRPPTLLLLLLLAACGRDTSTPAPPPINTAVEVPLVTSRAAVPVSAQLTDLEHALEREIPRTLLRIDRQEKACVPASRATRA